MHNCITLGTAQFGHVYGIANQSGQSTLSSVRTILERAFSNDIRTLDTAIAYGISEQILGSVGVGAFHVISKLPPVPRDVGNDISAWVDAQVTGSLSRLGIDGLDALLLHRPSQLLSPMGEQLYKALQIQKAVGRVQRVGVSIYDPSELDHLTSRFNLDVVQAPLNIFDARLEQSGWIDRLSESGVALHVRSAFLQGLLLMPADQRPPYFDRWKSLWHAWSFWLNDHNLTPLQACLRYVLHADGVEQVVLGVDTPSQLTEILAAVDDGPLPDGYQIFQTQDPELLNPSLWKIK